MIVYFFRAFRALRMADEGVAADLGALGAKLARRLDDQIADSRAAQAKPIAAKVIEFRPALARRVDEAL